MRSMTGVASWPPTFLAEVERDPPPGVPMLWALGGPSFLYRTAETAIWIDPWFGNTPEGLPEDIFRSVAIPVEPLRDQPRRRRHLDARSHRPLPPGDDPADRREHKGELRGSVVVGRADAEVAHP